MKPEIKARWVAALRSGDYKQGTGDLRKGNSFCCLGVLCQIFSVETGTKWHSDGVVFNMLGEDVILPREVSEWAGIQRSYNPELSNGETLTTINDDMGWSFEQIANAIEAEL